VTTSWDDGHPLDLKLADLLVEYGVNGTFYVPLSNSEREVMGSASLVELAGRFEIGGHTRNHVDLRGLGSEVLDDEIRGAKLELEDVLGKQVSMFCYPNGKHSQRVRQAVATAGFIAARTTKQLLTECSRDVFRMPTTLHAFPQVPWIRVRHAFLTQNLGGIPRLLRIGVGKRWVDIARCFFEETLESGGVWHLWGHSWEIEEYNLWDDLRALLYAVANREGVTYLSNGQIMENVTELSTR